MSDKRDVVYTVHHDYRFGPHKLASAEVTKRTTKFAYIDRVAEFGYKARLDADRTHTDPETCLRDFIAHRAREIEHAEQTLDGMRKGLAWAQEMLRLQALEED